MNPDRAILINNSIEALILFHEEHRGLSLKLQVHLGWEWEGAGSSCQWTAMVGWKLFVAPLWKCVADGLTGKAEAGVQVARAET